MPATRGTLAKPDFWLSSSGRGERASEGLGEGGGIHRGTHPSEVAKAGWAVGALLTEKGHLTTGLEEREGVGARAVFNGRRRGGSGTQTFVHHKKKRVDKIFPLVNFVLPHDGHFDLERGGGGTRPWRLALLACGGAYWPLTLEPSAMTSRASTCPGGGGSRMQLLPMASSPDGLISARYAVITKIPGWEVLTTTSNVNATQGHGC